MYDPVRVYVHDGNGRRIAELPDAVAKRDFRTMGVGRALVTVPEIEPQLAQCDPREGRFLVLESSLYPLIWAGQLMVIEGGLGGTVNLEARSFEAVLQDRFLPSGTVLTGTSGGQFAALLSLVDRENYTGVVLDGNIAAGEPFDDTNYGDRSLYEAWTTAAEQTAHEWWIEHEVSQGQLVSSAHFRPARGEDRTNLTLSVGPWGNLRVNRWRMSIEGSAHRIRAVGGASSSMQAFSERTRVERRASKSAPVAQATIVQRQNTRHGYTFGKWPTGDTVLTRREQLFIRESVRGAGPLAIAAEAALTNGRTAQRAIDIEVQGYGDMWAECLPGNVITLDLPEPYYIEGYRGPAAILATEPFEEAGTLKLVCDVPNT